MSETVKPMELIHTVANENGKNGSNGNGHFENINGAENDREDKEITLDQADAWGFGGRGSNQPAQNVAAMPVERDSEIYNMNHRRRGVAIIFNHKCFDPRLGLKIRNGTDTDRDNLRLTLRQLDFEVRVFNDLPYKEMERIL